jgi:predicted secreted Zn-dependent protease
MDKMLSGAASIAKEDKVLAHEQLHFDLAETWARRLTSELLRVEAHADRESLVRLDLEAQVDRLKAAYWNELLDMQERYDDETVHGTRKRNQKEWSRQITSWLAEAGAATDSAPR